MYGKLRDKKHDYEVFLKNLSRNELSSVIFIHGREEYLYKKAIELIVNKYVNSAMRAMDYQIIDGKEADVEDIIARVRTVPMLSEKKVIWVKDFMLFEKEGKKGNGDKDRCLGLIEDLTSDKGRVILIFSSVNCDRSRSFTKKVMNLTQSYEFGELGVAMVKSFITKRCEKSGINLSYGQMEAYINSCGYFDKDSTYDLQQMENDLIKICALGKHTPLTEAVIKETICGYDDTYIFNFLDNIMDERKDMAFIKLGNILKDKSNMYGVIVNLVSQFEAFLMVKDLYDKGYSHLDIAGLSSIHKFRVQKLMPYCSAFSRKRVERILKEAYEIDKNIKTGLMDGELAMQVFLSRI